MYENVKRNGCQKCNHKGTLRAALKEIFEFKREYRIVVMKDLSSVTSRLKYVQGLGYDSCFLSLDY